MYTKFHDRPFSRYKVVEIGKIENATNNLGMTLST